MRRHVCLAVDRLADALTTKPCMTCLPRPHDSLHDLNELALTARAVLDLTLLRKTLIDAPMLS